MRNGEGIFYFKNGIICKGIWKNNEYDLKSIS